MLVEKKAHRQSEKCLLRFFSYTMKRFLPLKTVKKLPSNQEMKRFDACLRNLEMFDKNPDYFHKVVISDEHLVPLSVEKSFKKKSSVSKLTVIPFFDSKGLIYTHISEPNLNVNSSYFGQVLKNFRQELNKKRGLCSRDFVPILLDNATYHNHSTVSKTLEELRLRRLFHPSYSPDLNPCDYYLFTSLNERLRNKGPLTANQRTNDMIRMEVESLLNGEILETLMKELKLRWLAVCAQRLLLESKSLVL